MANGFWMQALSGLALFAAFVPVQASQSAIDHGRVVAKDACSACHKVTADQPSPPLVHNPDTLEDIATPSFADIARMDGDKPRFLREFINAPSHPMKEQTMLPADVEDIVLYIQSLGPKKRPRS